MSVTVADMTTSSFASQRSKTSVLGADSGLGLPAMVLKCVATADKAEFNASSPLPVRVATSPLENASKKSTPPLISLGCHPPVRETHSQFLHHFNSQKRSCLFTQGRVEIEGKKRDWVHLFAIQVTKTLSA